MTEEAALLAEIVANPEDDAPRLVLADWWTQRGDPRGEFVVAQCALAREEAKPAPELGEVVRLTAVIGALLRQHEVAWLAQLGVTSRQITWKRGFVEWLRGEPSLLAEAQPALFAHPITDMSWSVETSSSAEILAACALPWPPSLRSLTASDVPGDVPLVATLATAPVARRLTALALRRCALGDRELAMIAELAAPLRKIDLDGNSFAPEAFARFLERRRPYLHDLSIGGSQTPPELIESLADRPELCELRELWIGDEQIPERAALAVVASPHLGQLTSLTMWRVPIGDAGLAELARAPALRKLERLWLYHATFTETGVRALASSPLAAITTLAISGAKIGDAGASAIAETFHALRDLDAEGCGLSTRGALALARSPMFARLGRLELGDNDLAELGADAGELVGPMMTSLGLSRANLSDAAVAAIAHAPELAHVDWLDLSLTRFGDAAALALAESPFADHISYLFFSDRKYQTKPVMTEVGEQALRARFGARWS